MAIARSSGGPLLEPALVVVDAGPLHGGHGDAELIADPIGQLLRLVDQRERGVLVAPSASG